jgi:hypothetical protein
VQTLRLLHDHALCRAAFGVAEAAPFEPHLSLAYGTLGVEQRTALAGELAERCPRALKLTTLDVVRTHGPVADWRRLARFALESPTVGHGRDDA